MPRYDGLLGVLLAAFVAFVVHFGAWVIRASLIEQFQVDPQSLATSVTATCVDRYLPL